MGTVNQLMAKRGVSVRRGRVDIHRDQGIVERFNRTLAELLFGHQYAQETRLPSGQRFSEWVARLPAVVAALNGEVTRLTGKMPKDAIKAMSVAQKPSSTIPGHQVGLKEQKLPTGVAVCYLYQPGELEGGRLRATGLIQYGPSRGIGSDARWPSPMNLCCITCSTGHRICSSARNFLLCPLIHRCRRMWSCLGWAR